MAETIKKYLDQAGLEQLVAKIKSEDVKVKEAANAYADSLAKNYDASGSAATAKSEAIADADAKFATVNENIAKKADQTALEAEVTRATGKEGELQAAIDGVSGVANKNKEDIATINNETTGILAQAKADATEKANAVQANVDALAGKVGTVPEGSTVMGIIENIQENAYDDTELRGLINGLDSKKADKTQVATDIETAVNAEKSARETAVAGVQSAVDTLSGTHATDKAALEGAIALKADKTALDAVSDVANAAATKTALQEEVTRATGEEARIEGLVTAEVAKAREEEGKLDARLVKVETFFETAEGETISEAMDTLVEIQKYITEDGSAADQMVKDIAANKKAIEDHVAIDHDFASADATLKAELEGKINAKADKTYVDEELAKKANTTYVDEELAKKADKSYVDEELGKKATTQALTDAVAALEGVDAGQETRIAALEAKFGEGEGNVEDMIAEAKQQAIDTAAGDATSKANTAESNAKSHADGLNTAMNARVEALEAIDHEHANKDLLDTYTQTEANLADAVAKKHEHANAAELNKIVDGDVAKWNAAEQNAKDYADGLNNSMTSKVDGVDGRVKTLEETIVDKAEADDLAAAIERIAKNESDIAANASAIGAFSPIATTDIDALFA